jgi:branched-chain amino acid transport system permease protein
MSAPATPTSKKNSFRWPPGEYLFLLVLLAIPCLPFRDHIVKQISVLMVYALLALGLHVIVGYTGLLHLGIAAFFGIGAYATGILASDTQPFHWSFVPTLLAACLASLIVSFFVSAPTLRLRGDYLAIVTLGFGEVVRSCLRNLENITQGTKSIDQIPPFVNDAWPGVDRKMFLIILAILAGIVFLLRNIERSRLGRAWIAMREDELAATCMGIDVARIRMAAFATGSALAGLAGCLYAYLLSSTAQPDSFDFSRSIITLCCLILGGLGGIRGALIGVFLLIGFDNFGSSLIDPWLQGLKTKWLDVSAIPAWLDAMLKFSSWRLMIFGVALILMMRFRPEGLWPASRVQLELHEFDDPDTSAAETPGAST